MIDYLRIDISSLSGKLDAMKASLTTANYKKVLYRALKRTGEHARTLTGREVRKDYHIAHGKVLRTIKNPRISYAPDGVKCILPIIKNREPIGGGGFAYTTRGGVAAKIVKTGKSMLPTKGGRPHFAVKSKGRVYVRLAGSEKTYHKLKRSKKTGKVYALRRQPIAPAVGIGIPQMPLTRSKDRIQDQVLIKMAERLEHEHSVIMKGIV